MTSLSRLLASAVIIAACAMPLPALAAKQNKSPVTTRNTPKGDWIVGPINAPSSSGVGYCSMKNDYADGLSLVFARDAEGSNSIAIDFHKNLLKTGGQYDVTLKSGSAVRKSSSIAATPSVLIMQMGLERDFYTVMSKKDTLVMEFGSAQASFSLAGTTKAMEVLTQCAQALGAGKKFNETKVAVSGVPATTVAAIQPAAGEGSFTGYLGGEKPAVAPLANQPAKDSLAMQSLNEELKQQIAELKLQNRKLLAENQSIAERMIATDSIGAEVEVAIKAESEDRERALAAENMRLRAALNEAPEPAPVAVEQVEPAAGEAASAPVLLPALLEAAHIAGEADSRNAGALVWGVAEDVYGSGEERTIDKDISAAVTAYMNEVRARCGGDFANTSGKAQIIKGRQVIESEIACLDGKNDAAAALLFVEEDGNLAVISHETAPARMPAALAARDTVISAISGK